MIKRSWTLHVFIIFLAGVLFGFGALIIQVNFLPGIIILLLAAVLFSLGYEGWI